MPSPFNSATPSLLRRAGARWPVLAYAATWTALLAAAVAVASFAPELAFVAAISSSSPFSAACGGGAPEGLVRVPMDLPGEVTCLPSHMFRRSHVDLLVPPVFAAVVVTGSACVVRALGLWEEDEAA